MSSEGYHSLICNVIDVTITRPTSYILLECNFNSREGRGGEEYYASYFNLSFVFNSRY